MHWTNIFRGAALGLLLIAGSAGAAPDVGVTACTSGNNPAASTATCPSAFCTWDGATGKLTCDADDICANPSGGLPGGVEATFLNNSTTGATDDLVVYGTCRGFPTTLKPTTDFCCIVEDHNGSGGTWEIEVVALYGTSYADDLAFSAVIGGSTKNLIAPASMSGDMVGEMKGRAGDDRMIGSRTNTLVGETLEGDDGNDDIRGFNGDDTLYGGPGIDYLDGGGNEDYLDGGGDGDILVGGDSSDNGLLGMGGVDGVCGDAATGAPDIGDADYGDPTVYSVSCASAGSPGNDTIDGGGAGDYLYGQDGGDTITGGGGADHISGGGGTTANNLDGGDGDDVVCDEGKADDTLVGGTGADTVVHFGHATLTPTGFLECDVLTSGSDAYTDEYYRGPSGNEMPYNASTCDTPLTLSAATTACTF